MFNINLAFNNIIGLYLLFINQNKKQYRLNWSI